jgi:hypothetical protein
VTFVRHAGNADDAPSAPAANLKTENPMTIRQIAELHDAADKLDHACRIVISFLDGAPSDRQRIAAMLDRGRLCSANESLTELCELIGLPGYPFLRLDPFIALPASEPEKP